MGMKRRDTKWELSSGDCISMYGVSYRLRPSWSLHLPRPHPVAVGFSDICHWQAPWIDTRNSGNLNWHISPIVCVCGGGTSKNLPSPSVHGALLSRMFPHAASQEEGYVFPFHCEGSEGQRDPLLQDLEVRFSSLESPFPLPPAISDSG